MTKVTIDLVGDVNLHRHVDSDASGLDDVTDELKQADIRLANLEGCFGDASRQLKDKAGWYHCQPEMATNLVGNFDLVSCANNVHHPDYVAESLTLLDKHGILHTGAGVNIDEAHRPAVFDTPSLRVGALGYTSIFQTAGQEATETQPGVATIKAHTSYEAPKQILFRPGTPSIVHTWADPDELARATDDVRRLRADVDFLVVYMHFGASSSGEIGDYQKEIGHALIDAGANVVAGSHSHTVNGVEFYGDGVIFYGLGNFVFNTGFLPHATRDGALAKLTVEDGAIQAVALLPSHRADGDRTKFVDLSVGEGARLTEMITSRCQEFDTRVEPRDGVLALSR